ncbi:MAG: hypothetical protein O8C68_03430 [Candidatus Methanoperedens sp.]|nr:hypothetical protein [Candidatus Methanoperedens sp.]
MFLKKNSAASSPDQLMSLCEELEARLERSHADSERLMEAVVSIVSGEDCKKQISN